MRVNEIHRAMQPAARLTRLPYGKLLYRWAAFLLCMLLVWAFIFILAPQIARLPAIKQVQISIEQSGIDASALYYTEVEEASEAEMYLKNSNEYSPGEND